MAITADDVSLEDIIPISLDFAVVEGKQFYTYSQRGSAPQMFLFKSRLGIVNCLNCPYVFLMLQSP